MGKSGRRLCKKRGCNKECKKACKWCGVGGMCKDHCDCKGTANAKGRRAPRPAKEERQQLQVAQPPPEPAPVIPAAAGRPPSTGLEVYTDSSWLDQAIEEMKGAKHVVLASYVFNNHQVQSLLTKKLDKKKKGRGQFECIIAVDRSAYEKNTAPGEKNKLKELKDFGAAIHLCDGQRGSGIFHWKCIIVDSKVVFSGSANVTQGCLNNWELVFRVVGPKVKVIKDGLEKPLANAARL